MTLLPPRCGLFWSNQHKFHVCLLSFSSFWPSSLLLLSPRAWLWPGSAFQFYPLRRCGIRHAHHFCVQSHGSVHLCWGQDWCEKVGQLFSTLQLQGKIEYLAITMVTLRTSLSWIVWADKWNTIGRWGGDLVQVRLCAVATHVQPTDSWQIGSGLSLGEGGLNLVTLALWKSMQTDNQFLGSSWSDRSVNKEFCCSL